MGNGNPTLPLTSEGYSDIAATYQEQPYSPQNNAAAYWPQSLFRSGGESDQQAAAGELPKYASPGQVRVSSEFDFSCSVMRRQASLTAVQNVTGPPICGSGLECLP